MFSYLCDTCFGSEKGNGCVPKRDGVPTGTPPFCGLWLYKFLICSAMFSKGEIQLSMMGPHFADACGGKKFFFSQYPLVRWIGASKRGESVAVYNIVSRTLVAPMQGS